MAANTKKNQEVTEEIKEKATTKVDDSKVEKNEVSTVENTETQVAEPKKGIVGTVVGIGTAVKNGVTGFAKKHPVMDLAAFAAVLLQLLRSHSLRILARSQLMLRLTLKRSQISILRWILMLSRQI